MADEIRAGLLEDPPAIPSKYFYDDAGSRLFEEITRLPEYYQTRTEEGILRAAADPVVARFRPTELLELGSGDSRKTRILLDAMARSGRLRRCVLFDINERSLRESLLSLAAAYPGLEGRGWRATSPRTSARSVRRGRGGWPSSSGARSGTCCRPACPRSWRACPGSCRPATGSCSAWTWSRTRPGYTPRTTTPRA